MTGYTENALRPAGRLHRGGAPAPPRRPAIVIAALREGVRCSGTAQSLMGVLKGICRHYLHACRDSLHGVGSNTKDMGMRRVTHRRNRFQPTPRVPSVIQSQAESELVS